MKALYSHRLGLGEHSELTSTVTVSTDSRAIVTELALGS